MKKIYQRISEIQKRLREVADTLETEKRAVNDEEKKEINALEREMDILMLRARAYEIPAPKKEAKNADIKQYFRAVMNTGKNNISFRVREEGAEPANPNDNEVIGASLNTMLTTDLEGKAIMPLTVGEIIKPLREELIYSKIGIRIPTGCRGLYEWPVVEAIKATVAGEGVKVDATKIQLDKVAAVTQRIAVGVSVTRESLFQSAGKLESIIREQLPLAIAETVNEILTSTEKITDNCAITGPFVGMTPTAIDYTFKGFNKAKASLLAKNVKSARMCWVMTESTKAELEATPKDAGSGIMLIENDRLCGLPVYCSSHIGEGNVGLGDFTYQVCAQFGDFYLVVDPYTGADANMVNFWLNSDFGTAKLRKETFALFKSK